ncbi:MAG TPA: YraN family protein [Syntrophomonadaceae bacterium]|nr:YraN family protein [Syntrophomonadaceae bacterium]
MKRKLGIKGEDMATEYLKKKGYKIITRNFYTRYGEIDIICEKAGALVFVEVKTRRSTTYGTPEEAMTARKIEHFKKAALIYLDKEKRFFKELQFDFIGILIQAGDIEINHITNAF